MTKISREETLHIAKISRISIHEDEIAPLMKQLDAVLSYAERVKEVASMVEEVSNKNMNVFREDVVVKTDPAPIISQAPEHEAHYFVVPAILDNK
ncbi:Asp-tRNA(Asn)/Glu-tRNA(Gln) amidotransferase subunit GatC [Candidatus Dependentiae bacterium]|nr:Asp-tRNA(Asn)/Glu-tRNA(Gln) amidotransferase subunit GatC [Candidatus Dependentiae bacterium]